MMNAGGMNDLQWDLLLNRIEDGECTPFLGAGACRPYLPDGQEIAELWKNTYSYPLRDVDLTSVTQFIAVTADARGAKALMQAELLRRIRQNGYPNFDHEADIHGVLAQLPLPIYMTTNYDDFIHRALQWANSNAGRKAEPFVDYCRWHRGLRAGYRFPHEFVPSANQPLVYHLHGTLKEPSSIVVTEDDYEDFIVELTSDRTIIPEVIKEAISTTPLLFIGYSLRDWNFRVIFRAAIKGIERTSRVKGVTVQISPDEVTDKKAAEVYLRQKYERIGLEIYWGTAQDFASDLGSRWSKRHSPPDGFIPPSPRGSEDRAAPL